MNITTIETITNGVSKPDEQSLKFYECKKCLHSEIKSAQNIFEFKTKKELFHHYLSAHDEDDNDIPLNTSRMNPNVYDTNVQKVQLIATTPQPVQKRKIAQKKVLQQSLPLSTDSQPLTMPRKKVNFKYSDNEDTENDQDDDALNQTTTVKKDTDLDRKLKSASDQDLKYFNLSTFEIDAIDEQKLSERLESLYAGKRVSKALEIKKNMIVWAQWRHKGKQLWWPSKVENVTRKNSKLTITIRYFEENVEKNLSQYTFKMELSKIQLFFRPIEDHFENKVFVEAI